MSYYEVCTSSVPSKKCVRKVHFGHGPLSTVQVELLKYHHVLQTCWVFVPGLLTSPLNQKEVGAGKY